MGKCGLNKGVKTVGTLVVALLMMAAVLAAAPQSAKAVAWLPTQAIVEVLQDFRESHVTKYCTPHPRYILTADNFVLHLDDFDDLDDASIIELSNALVSAEDETSLEATPTIVIKEGELYPEVGVYELTLGLEESFDEKLEKDFEESCEAISYEGNIEEGSPYFDIDTRDYLGLFAVEFPSVQIYVFVVDDNTTIEEGVVFYANNFRKNFTERENLTAQIVKERAQASAYKVLTGLCLGENIFLDKQELTEFVQSDRLEAQTLSLSVPATATPMTAEEAVDLEIPIVSTSILIRTRDDRPPIEYIPTPPPRPPANDSGNDGGNNNNNNNVGGGNNNNNAGGGNNNNNNNNAGSGNNNNAGGGNNNNNAGGGNNNNNNDGDGGSDGNNNVGDSDPGDSSAGTGGTSNVSGSGSDNERRPAWTSSVTRSPAQVTPSTPAGTEDESDDEEILIASNAPSAGTADADVSPAPEPRQAAPAVETAEEMNPLIRNAIIAVGLTALVAAVIALYLYLQNKNLQRKKSKPASAKSKPTPIKKVKPAQRLEPLP